MIGVLISLAVTVLVVWILLKKMKAQFVLFFGGLVLLVSRVSGSVGGSWLMVFSSSSLVSCFI